MFYSRRRLLAAGAALGLSPGLCAHAQAPAQAYPQKPVRIVVPFTAGGASDALTRALAQELAALWKQAVIVDNKPGANTIIAAQAVAQSPADGSTLLLATDSTLSINPTLYKKLPYDPAAFEPVVNLASVVSGLVIGPLPGVDTLGDLIAAARAKPGALAYASFGVGSTPHLDAVSFMQLADVKLLHVPYKGVADATQALLSGEVQLLFAGIGLPLQHIRAGKLKALAVGLPSRSTLLPEVPTFAEAGLPRMTPASWIGLVAPAQTPLAIRRQISDAVNRVMQDAAFRDKTMTSVGLEPAAGEVAAFGEFLKANRAAYAAKVQAANATGLFD